MSGYNIVGGTGATSGGGGLPGAPGNVTLGSPQVRIYNGEVVITIPYDPPAVLGNFDRIHVYLQIGDDSTAAKATLNGAGTGWVVSASGSSASIIGNASEPISKGVIPYNATERVITITHPAPKAVEVWRVYAVSGSPVIENVLVPHDQPGATPSALFPVDPFSTAPPAGTEYAPNAASFTLLGVDYRRAENGQWLYRFRVAWTNPTSDPRYGYLGGYDIVLEGPNGDRVLHASVSLNQSPYEGPWWPVDTVKPVTVWLVSYGERFSNTIIKGFTPSVSYVISPPIGAIGEEYAPMVTGLRGAGTIDAVGPGSEAVQYSLSVDGVEVFNCYVKWTPFTDRPEFGGVAAYLQVGATRKRIGRSTNRIEMETEWQTVPQTTTYQLIIVSMDTFGRENSITASTPRISVTVGPRYGGRLKANRFDPATFNTSEFQISGGQFQANSFGASKIFVGSILRVGGGAGAFSPSFGGGTGQIAVYNSSNQLRFWAGQNGPVVGMWAKEAYLGGDDPSSAPIYANAAGVVIIGGINVGTPYVSIRTNAGTEVGRIGANIDTGFHGAYFKQLRVGGASVSSPRMQADAGGNLSINNASFSLVSGSESCFIDASSGSNFIRLQSSSTGFTSFIAPSGFYSQFASSGQAFQAGMTGISVTHLSTNDFEFSIQNFGLGGHFGQLTIRGPLGAVTITGGASGGISVLGNRVLSSRKLAIGSAAGSHSTSDFAGVNAALNALALKINEIVNRLGASSGHGLTSD